MRAVILSIFLLFSLAICADVQQATHTVTGSAGGPDGVIFYSDVNSLAGAVQGSITVEIAIEDSVPFPSNGVNFCFNSDQTFPVSGLDIANSCPNGGYAVFTNSSTGTTAEPMKFRISARNSAFKNQFFSKMIQIADNGISQMVNGYQSTAGPQFVASINGGDSVYNFTVTYTYDYCANSDEVAVNGVCEKITEITLDSAATEVTVPAGEMQYYYFNVDSYNTTVNNEVTITFTGSSVYVQRNTIPTSTYNLFPTNGDASPYVIVTPSRIETGYTETYFIVLDNTDGTDAANFSIQVNTTGCASNSTFGEGCAYSTATTTSTDINTDVFTLSANYTGSTSNAFEFDASDSTSGYQYFLIDQLPFNDTLLPYYVRVTVGNDVIDGDDDTDQSPAPQILAKLNGYPSPTSNDYNVANGLTNQLVLPVTSLEDQWYLAVSLSSGPKFSIWVGSNCANGCDDNAHGSCMCYNITSAAVVDCNSFGDDYFAAYYESLPQSTMESNGECECSDDSYSYSYDCSEKPPSTILFVTLIVIGGLIILFVAIGVPLYCYISNKRKERYERI